MRNGENLRRFRHAPRVRNREQDVQVTQPDPATDAIIPAHDSVLSKIANLMQDNSTFLLRRKRYPSIVRCSVALERWE
jgi:hypothetical protein